MLYVSIKRVAFLSLNTIKRKWEEELEFDISDVNWRWAVGLIHTSSVCVRHGLIVLHRLHLSRDKLAIIYLFQCAQDVNRVQPTNITCSGHYYCYLYLFIYHPFGLGHIGVCVSDL